MAAKPISRVLLCINEDSFNSNLSLNFGEHYSLKNKNELLFYDIAGKELKRFTVTGSTHKANLSFLKPGMYFYSLSVNGKNSGAGKVVVQK